MSDRLAETARELAGQLAATAPLWRPPCFYDDPPWVTDRPVLAAALLALDDVALATLENDPAQLDRWCSRQAPALPALARAADDCLHGDAMPAPLAVPEALGRDVPGRKWQQTLAFAAACGTPRGPVVDWCCGKAHLGRLLSRLHGVAVTGVERSSALCEAGRELAAREHLPVQWHAADVLLPGSTDGVLSAQTHAVALHACGELHLSLLHRVVDAGTSALDLAPCCYHLSREARWQPLSLTLSREKLATLGLTRNDLRLAVQETVTASARVVAQTRKMAGWRLGFDALQRELRGIDTALPTPSRPARVLTAGFVAFCEDMASHHAIRLPRAIDFTRYETTGHARQQRSRRLQLIRHACRRSLEVMLVADRALWMAEHGYEVRIREFCARRLTPRNLLLQARFTRESVHG